MVEKLKFYLGYDQSKSIRAIDAKSLLICGGNGSGKTLFLNNFIYNLLLHNSRNNLCIKYYTNKYGNKDIVFHDKSNVLPLVELINESKSVSDFIESIVWNLEDRENTLRLAGCDSIHEYNNLFEDKIIKETVYIIDGLSTNITYGTHAHASLRKVLETGAKYGIYVVLTDTDVENISDSMINCFTGRIALYCSEEASNRVLGCNAASNKDIITNHIAVFKDNIVYHGLQYFRVPGISKEKMRLALDIFNQL